MDLEKLARYADECGELYLLHAEKVELIARARRLEKLETMLRELYPFTGAPPAEEQLREVIDQSCAFAEAHQHVERLRAALRIAERDVGLLRHSRSVPFPLRGDLDRIHENLVDALGGKP
jgi:hypothetical protein